MRTQQFDLKLWHIVVAVLLIVGFALANSAGQKHVTKAENKYFRFLHP